jgi:predicted enzyme related to lactoylglutathione lyase
VPYVLVDYLKAATDKAESLGAALMKDVTEVPGMGSFTIITDAAGGHAGVVET